MSAAQKKKGEIKLSGLNRLSSAIRRLATAASSHVGSDCYIHAALGQAILARLGVKSKLVAGYAGFRVGNGDSDVILHAPVQGMVPQPDATPFHVWLEIGDHILDLTTYQREKAAQLDALDGGYTDVSWCPDYIYVPKSLISTLSDVVQLQAGLFYYERDLAVEAQVLAASHELDETDVETAWLLYHNQEIAVFGPNYVVGGYECSAGPGEAAAGPGAHAVNPEYWC